MKTGVLNSRSRKLKGSALCYCKSMRHRKAPDHDVDDDHDKHYLTLFNSNFFLLFIYF